MSEDKLHFLVKQLDELKSNHFFVLVEEAHGYVLGTTKFAVKAVNWYLKTPQSRWNNPAVYVCNYRPKDRGECSVPITAVPILSTYNHLREGISILRKVYLKRFPNELIKKAGESSW